MNYTDNDPLFIGPNSRDGDMIDLYTRPINGPVAVWGTVHVDFISALKSEVGEFFDLRGESNELEVVMISREHYEALVEQAERYEQLDEPDFPDEPSGNLCHVRVR
jgi:hypothetical protein